MRDLVVSVGTAGQRVALVGFLRQCGHARPAAELTEEPWL
jgi:hypothetical protein